MVKKKIKTKKPKKKNLSKSKLRRLRKVLKPVKKGSVRIIERKVAVRKIRVKKKIKPKKVVKTRIIARPKKKNKPRIIVKIKKKVKKKAIKVFGPMVDPTVHKTKIRVIGIGGGGSTIVSEITSRVKKADFYVANTDVQALKESSKVAKRFQFGQNLTRGLGTGMNVELGETAALEEKEKIERILEGQDLCIIIACLGGGTSSGATPVFANISKKLGNITYGIFTLPFEFEGTKKMEAALEALEKIKPNLNVYTIVPNERIFQIVDKNTPLREALSAINKNLADNLEGLIEMVYLPGLINIDFADLRTVLSGRGRLTYLNNTEIEEIAKEEVEKKLIYSPLYPYTVKGAKGVLYNITSGKSIQLSEVSRISHIISESVNKKAKIIFGINQNQKYQNKIRITLLATGCLAKGFFASHTFSKKKAQSKPRIKRSKIKKIVKKITPPSPTVSSSQSSKKNKNKITKLTDKSSAFSGKKIKKKGKPIKTKTQTKKLPSVRSERIIKIKEKLKPSKPLISKEKKESKPLTFSKKKMQQQVPKPKIVEEKKEQTSEIPIRVVQPAYSDNGEKVRKNALQVRKEAEQAEKELLEQEKIWDVPAILRRKNNP